MKQKMLSLLATSTLCLYSVAPLSALDHGDTSAPPAFRNLSNADELSQSLIDAKADSYLEAFNSGNGAFPECGWRVIYIVPGSKFSKLGIPLGSLIERIGNQRYLGHTFGVMVDDHVPSDAPNTMVCVTPENGRKEIPVDLGKLGYTSIGFRNLPNWYLRHGARNPDWDRFVVAALMLQGRNPAAAESFWLAAMEKGYVPDKLSSWSGMMISLINLELERAGDFARQIIPFEIATKPSDLPILTDDIERLALLTGDSTWFRHAGITMQRHAPFSQNLANHLYQVKLAASLPAGMDPPSKLADSMDRKSFLMTPDTSATSWCDNLHSVQIARMHERAAAAHHKGEEEFPAFTVSAPMNRHAKYVFSPLESSENLDVRMTFRAEPAAAPRGQANHHDRFLKFGLADRNATAPSDNGPPINAQILVSILSFGSYDIENVPAWRASANGTEEGFSPTPVIHHGFGSQPSALLVPTIPVYPNDPQKVHTLRLTRVGRQAEALLDGRRLALVHVPENLKSPAVYFNVSGCKITVTSFAADTLTFRKP